MEEFRFTALGTQWTLQSDGLPFSEETQKAILSHTESFEDRFSRFRDHSESNKFRQASAGTYEISPEMARMLERAVLLRELTGGKYDPAVAPLLEKAGYDKAYRFTPDESVTVRIPAWELQDGKLVLDGPAGFDFGGMGKGLCIDELSEILRAQGHLHFLVDGGGDMYATRKRSGEGFRIALEWPGQPDTAFGMAELSSQGLAASDSFRRRWGKWHHIVDPSTQTPVAAVVGAVAVGQTAWDADSATAALFQVPFADFSRVQEALGVEYVIFQSDTEVKVSPGWAGSFF